MRNKWMMTVAVILLSTGSVFLFRAFQPSPQELLKKRVAERSLGDPKAPLVVAEYFDYQCPPCAVAYKVLEDWVKKYPGKIYLQTHFFPLPAHKNAMKAAVCAECAARQKGKFWAIHGLLFTHQSEWANDSYAELKFLTYAQEALLDLGQWDACVKDPEIQKFISQEKTKGESLGVKTTPSFFVNGQLVVGVEKLAAELEKIENKKAPSS